jgi:hypothetical protein
MVEHDLAAVHRAVAQFRQRKIGDDCMNGLQFASSLIASLSWSLVVIILVVVFRPHLGELIGRIRSYKGLGQEVTFGDRLADAENSVEEAVRSVPVNETDPKQIEKSEPSPLSRDAEANPSFVVIRAWEQVVDAVNALAEIAFPGRHSRSRGFSTSLLVDLQRAELVSPQFVSAASELRDLRNRVAHGMHNPTPGEAVAYAESANSLSAGALTLSDLIKLGVVDVVDEASPEGRPGDRLVALGRRGWSCPVPACTPPSLGLSGCGGESPSRRAGEGRVQLAMSRMFGACRES